MTAQAGPGGHWSASNPIPTVQKFLEGLDQDKKERDRQIDEENKQKQKYQEEQDQHRQKEETDAAPHTAPLVPRSKGRKVTDPTTGKEVEIDDVGKEFMKAVKDPQLSVPNANLGKDTPIKTEPSQTAEEYKYAQDVTAPPDPIAEGTTSDVPIRGEKTNILFHPTPTISFEPMYKVLEKRAGVICITTFISIVFPGKILGAALKGLIPLAFCIASAIWLWMQDLIRRGRANEWYSEQRRGESATANLLPESVEWMNTFMAILWGLLNPDMFASVGDTIEDVMQASVPGVVENVRVAEISQGSNPFRILSMRALPDEHANHLKDNLSEFNKKNKSPQEAAADSEGGDHYNLEISFAYHAKPSDASSSAKAANMHMLLVFYLGIKGLFGVPLPIFAELKEFVGTVRLRLQLTPEPPFAKTVTFSLMGLPHVRAGCTPMVRTGVNILNLPLISNFVNYAIGAAASLYVAPKSMSLDVRMMLQGDDIQKETQALGIMWVRIHRAIGLSKQDSRGSEGGGSDPYINLSFSKYGKPMYCTRVITDDCNPVWEEYAALLVNPELLKADEQLSVELWDSDRNTADDIVGKIELSMQEMIQHPGKMFSMSSRLQGMHADTEMPGELQWEVGYFGKPQFRPALLTDGKDPNLLPNMRDHPSLQDDKGNVNTDYDYAVTHTPPDPLWPSGICSIVIHQIVNLSLAEIKGSYGRGNRKDKEYVPAKSYGENTEEQGKNLPTSYCTILLNDTLVYRTRAKAVSSKPIFNAGTERFVRDWRSAIVTVTVRDQRYREHDPILGVVPLKLSDILQTSSQATRWYPLDGGIGFGRVRISLLFRSVETKLPPQLLGWDVGTFEFASNRINVPGYNHHAKLKIRTSGVSGTLPRSSSNHDKHTGGCFFDISTDELKHRIRIPVKHRHRSAIIFELHGGGPTGYATVWLNTLVDNTDIPIDVPLWSTKMPNRLLQNYITESNWKDKRSPGLEDLKQIGRLQFTCRFSPGIDESHERYVTDNNSRETFESWEACISEGVRERSVSNELPETVRELHEKSLVEGRDVLRQQGQVDQPEQPPQSEQPEHREQSHWVSADGTDFRKAFGDNPHALAADEQGSQRGFDAEAEAERQRQRYSSASRGSVSAGSHGSFNADTQNLHAMTDGLPNDDDGAGPSGHHGNRSSSSMGQNRVSMDEMRDHLNQNAGSIDHNRSGSNSSLEQHGDEDIESFTTSSTNRRSGETNEERLRRIGDRANKRAERRKMRGSMQWKPARNVAFAKHESEFALNKIKKKFAGGLQGREPGVETETGT